MFFRKTETEKKWGDFRFYDQCQNCGHTSQGAEFDRVCPECGSENFKEVVGRWLVSWTHCGILSDKNYHEFQERVNSSELK